MANRNRQKINNLLGGYGLATMDNPRGMVQQLGFLVRDHDHFRQMLVKCEPEHRTSMYESLKPYLRFPAKPLEDYIIAAKQDAEARQLPVLGEDGQLHPFKVGEIRTDGVEEAAVEQLAKVRLHVVCRKCTKEAVFSGLRKIDAVNEARLAGWVHYEIDGVGREVCPDCPVGETDKAKDQARSKEEFELVTDFKMAPASVISRYMPALAPSSTKADWDAQALEAAREWAKDGRPGAFTPSTV
jgi:hypothetical protein